MTCRCNRAKAPSYGYRIEPTCPEHGVLATKPELTKEALRFFSLIVAAYVNEEAQDWGEPYRTALEDVATRIGENEPLQAYAHGELDLALQRMRWPGGDKF